MALSYNQSHMAWSNSFSVAAQRRLMSKWYDAVYYWLPFGHQKVLYSQSSYQCLSNTRYCLKIFNTSAHSFGTNCNDT